MKRRAFAAAAAVLIIAGVAARRHQTRHYRVGALVCPVSKGYFLDLKARLDRAHPGRYEYTVYESMDEGKLGEYAQQLMRERPDLIVTTCYKSSGPMAAAAKGTKQPVLFLSNVGQGVIADKLLSGSGNVTGLSIADEDGIEAGLKALKEMLPGLARVGVLADPHSPSYGGRYGERDMFEKLGARLNLKVEFLEASGVEQARRLLVREARHGRFDALVTSGPLGEVAGVLARHGLSEKIPTLTSDDRLVKAGALLGCHSAVEQGFWEKGREMAEKILGGVRPADLPVATPERYLLSINLDTAKRLGLRVPDSLRQRADQLF
jgi:putative tryptophan/tyrosine transport system substrate-binding protein